MKKGHIKERIPQGLLGALRSTNDWFNRLPEQSSTLFHPWMVESRKKMKKFQDKFAGERCFVIGNGPSLKKTDLSKLEHEFTFGMNRIYLMFEEMGFPTSFLVSVNDLVIEQTADEMQILDIPRFYSWRARKWLLPEENLFFLNTSYTGLKFAKDITKRMWEGATVTYICLQLAYYFGFSKVILIGVDHSFATKGKPNTTVVSQGDDPNHFHPGYFGKGFRWQLPDLDTSEIGYQMARLAFEADDKEIVDATIDGKLTIFKKAKYEDLFKGKKCLL